MVQEVQIYDNNVLVNSCYYQDYRSTLADIAFRDYRDYYGFSSEVEALDIDSIEKNTSGINDKTMDAAIGIANYRNNAISNPRFLLVELRMNYTRAQNAKTSDMKEKDIHTRALLSGCEIDGQSFFIFNKNVAPCKKSLINRKSKVDSSLKSWVILSPEEFVNRFQFRQNLPYKPESPIEDIRKKSQIFIKNAKSKEVIDLISYWLKQVEIFYSQYKLEECKVLIALIDEISSDIEKNCKFSSEDEELDFLIEKEKLSKFKNYSCFRP